MPSSPPAAPTIRTRSTTCCASRSSSAARSMPARRRSRARWKSPPCTRSPTSHARARAKIVASAYGIDDLSFGPDYLIPKPFDPRLIVQIAPAVAKAAMESGVAHAPDRRLRRVSPAAAAVRVPVRHDHEAGLRRGAQGAAGAFAHRVCGRRGRARAARRADPRRRKARASDSGRPTRRASRIASSASDCDCSRAATSPIVNPEHDERHREFWMEYHRLMMRRGVTAQYAKLEMRRRTTLIAAMLLRKGAADGMICGTISTTCAPSRIHRSRASASSRARASTPR